MLCPDFPVAVIEDAVFAIDPIVISTPPKYSYGDIKVALLFHIMYSDWLRELQRIFISNATSSGFTSVSSSRLAAKFQSLQFELNSSVLQPPKEGLDSALNSLSSLLGKNAEISYDKLLRALYFCQILQEDVSSKPLKALPINYQPNLPTSSQKFISTVTSSAPPSRGEDSVS